MLEMFAIQYLTKFHFDSIYNSREIRISVTSIYAAIFMMMSQIWKSVNFTKRQKSRYLKNKTKIFFSDKKIH